MNIHEKEKYLEERFIKYLSNIGYQRTRIKNSQELEENFIRQIEKQNKTILMKNQQDKLTSEQKTELFSKIGKKNIFENAKILRDGVFLSNIDGLQNKIKIELLNGTHWCQNQFQVINQYQHSDHRYDVTLLINGIPLIQIELKTADKDIRKAFNQIKNYSKNAFPEDHFLFSYIQAFIISNEEETKYFANTPNSFNYKHTFYWTDETNKPYKKLKEFTDHFLKPCHLIEMIARYMILFKKDETDKKLIIMRSHQIYAVKKLISLSQGHKGGYVWHTTGSGKTLTSFKLSQLLQNNSKEGDKILFLVDRRDLDEQTIEEWRNFCLESGLSSLIGTTESTKKLIQKLNNDERLIISTIQKMNKACRSKDITCHNFQNNKVIFILDECHRSQTGEMHFTIAKTFPKAQFFGFTGTPLLEENNPSKNTNYVFGDCVHEYLIDKAINDKCVLEFRIDYYEEQIKKHNNSKTNLDKKQRISAIVETIIKIHNGKTLENEYNAILATNSISELILYYQTFKQKKHQLNITAICSYQQTNEDNNEEKTKGLELIVNDYNQQFRTNFVLKDPENYKSFHQKVIRQMKNYNKDRKDRIDILIVSDMLLTGFDSKYLNTLYIDKELNQKHSLIQAFSRTNRIAGINKEYGEIVSFRIDKKQVDEAIEHFSKGNYQPLDNIYCRKEMKELISNIKKFKQNFLLWQNDNFIENLEDNKDDLNQFKKNSNSLIRQIYDLKSFKEFSFDPEDKSKINIGLSEEEFRNLKTKFYKAFHSSRRQSNSDNSISSHDLDDNNEDETVKMIKIDTIIINSSYIRKLIENMKTKYSGKKINVSENFENQFQKIQEYFKNFSNEKLLKQIKQEFKFDKIFQIILDDNIHQISDEYCINYNNLTKEYQYYEKYHEWNIDSKWVEENITKDNLDKFKQKYQTKLLANVRNKIAKELIDKLCRLYQILNN